MLHNSADLTYTCVLSSMNAAKYNEWKDTDAVPDGILEQPTVPGQFTKDVAGLANRTFNGFYTGSAAISPFAVSASGSSTYKVNEHIKLAIGSKWCE